MLFQSHEDDEVMLPAGLLPTSMNGVLSLRMLECIRDVADDVEDVSTKDLYMIMGIAVRHKADRLVTMVMDEIIKRGKKSGWVFSNS